MVCGVIRWGDFHVVVAEPIFFNGHTLTVATDVAVGCLDAISDEPIAIADGIEAPVAVSGTSCGAVCNVASDRCHIATVDLAFRECNDLGNGSGPSATKTVSFAGIKPDIALEILTIVVTFVPAAVLDVAVVLKLVIVAIIEAVFFVKETRHEVGGERAAGDAGATLCLGVAEIAFGQSGDGWEDGRCATRHYLGNRTWT